ncbi:MAG: hypothetical protein OHK0029_42540 [Armatimonadaceae bacterium]
MLNERTRRYLLTAVQGTPVVLEALLQGITEDEADRRPDPERFTIREAVAHLADWEPIWRERLTAIAEKEHPHLPGYDEGQFAIDHDYAHSIVAEQAAIFASERAQLAAYLREIPEEVWGKTGVHGEMGEITFTELVTLLLAHDGYHLKQIAEYRQAAG